MNKKVFEKKLQALKEFGERYNWHFKTSAAGNYYLISSIRPQIKEWSAYNVTKATLNKIGETFEIPPICAIIMLTKTGKFLRKDLKSNKFIPINRHTYPELWYIGKKSEWILSKGETFRHLRLATQFSSFNEFKKFLGFEFISDNDFETLCDTNIELPILFANRTKQDRINLMQLYNNVVISDILDVLNMSKKLDKEVVIPSGKNSFEELHKELTLETYKINNPLFEVNVEIKNFDIPYSYEIVTSNYQLKERGRVNKHCIGSYADRMKTDLFIVIDGKYDAHIHIEKWGAKKDTWQLSQIRGYANCTPPIEMRDSISEALEKASINITYNKQITTPKEEIWEMVF